MTYRTVLVAFLVLTGCGEVKGESTVDAQIDAPAVCSIHDQVTSCGPMCVACTTATDRETASCDGMTCGMRCTSGSQCSDNSCSRLLFDFEAGTAQGVVAITPGGQTVAVRPHDGSMALAFDIANLPSNQLEFRVPVCLTGNIDLSTRMLKAAVYFEGGNDAGEQYYIQGSVPTPVSGNFLPTQTAAHNVTVNYVQPMSASAGSAGFNNVTFRIGSLGAAFSGTIWVDDIKIE